MAVLGGRCHQYRRGGRRTKLSNPRGLWERLKLVGYHSFSAQVKYIIRWRAQTGERLLTRVKGASKGVVDFAAMRARLRLRSP
ncbi:hypothetical protein EVAR_57971_1 [Eumeta japonica]|uniref:Uncharacterized protein n=1 Tax=Eumeta variegata TaxID=151549 RepID=A0A4C1Y0E8_EUMVA|nr:hypothetical protein EVAR_57971_1 [Eumeta japonica]